MSSWWTNKYQEAVLHAQSTKNFRPRRDALTNSARFRTFIEEVATIIVGCETLLSLQFLGSWYFGFTAMAQAINNEEERLRAILESASSIPLPPGIVEALRRECLPLTGHGADHVLAVLPATVTGGPTYAQVTADLQGGAAVTAVVTAYETMLAALLSDEDEGAIAQILAFLYQRTPTPVVGIRVSVDDYWFRMANIGMKFHHAANARYAPVLTASSPLVVLYGASGPPREAFTLLRTNVGYSIPGGTAANRDEYGMVVLGGQADGNDMPGNYYRRTAGGAITLTSGLMTSVGSGNSPQQLPYGWARYHKLPSWYGGLALADVALDTEHMYPGAHGSFEIDHRTLVLNTQKELTNFLGFPLQGTRIENRPVKADQGFE
jgi:hypothetical protein